ncbi:TRAP transporter small permease [Roseitalea porphyridii]|uniref:TRAP transporter small permease protein n=1 Tax=Roseitalea porphyridii TaxID=1852022 RepID=A0A4P6V3P5_9HYPH|nr:TRAP transporter small permease subunit [Roseitalea porphyridii]QBK31110.1 TRAP transporter small permease [Roseitalea porphyridii]
MYRFFFGLSRLMAVVGGIVLSALIVMVCVSIAGRALNGFLHADMMQSTLPGLADWLLDLGVGPVNGDFELVEAGIAFAIFSFLPYCQITSGHAVVSIFTDWMPMRAQQVLRMIIEILFALVLVVIAIQLKEGMDGRIRSGQTTFLLQFPIWWAYALSLVGATIAAAVAVYMALIRTAEAFTGRELIADDMGAEH